MRIILTVVFSFLITLAGFAQSSQQTTRDRDQSTGQTGTTGQTTTGHSGMTGQKSGHAGMMGQKSGQSGMTKSCQEMMQEHQQMMSEVQQQDKDLQAKVSAMNSASGDKKIQAMADVINTLATQRQERSTRMQQMQADMMTHMAEHMRAGGQSMANCPMMSMNQGTHAQGTTTKPSTGKSKAE
jgi:predicted RNase H-like nuclease (RuvC/YqgF family)